MSISSISLVNTPTNIQNWQAAASQRQQDFQSLASSLKSGDLNGAQQAYSELQTLASTNGSSSSGTSPMQQDFAAIGKDLSAGNLSQAQKDFTQLKNDFQAVLAQNGGPSGVHHHHGHHVHKVESSSSTSNTSTDPSLASAASGLFSPYASTTDTSMASTLFSLVG